MQVKITISVNREGRFKAKIKEGNKPSFKVLIGGKDWNNGVGREHEVQIKEELHKFYIELQKSFNSIIYK